MENNNKIENHERINTKSDKNETDITSSIPLNLDIPEIPINKNLDSYQINEYSIVSPSVNNIQNIPINNYLYKGKNLFNMNNNFESPFRTNTNIHFHSSPLGIKIGNYTRNLTDFDNYISNENDINPLNNLYKNNRNILSYLNFESIKLIRSHNSDIKLLKNDKLLHVLIDKLKSRKSDSKYIFNNTILNNDVNDEKENYQVSHELKNKPKIITNLLEETKINQKCKCKKSKCLKLYCECFSNGNFCQDCNCNNCHNNERYENERKNIINTLRLRNPEVFKSDMTTCNCSKSNCEKKYCSCYYQGIKCTDSCNCIDCKNNIPATNSGINKLLNSEIMFKNKRYREEKSQNIRTMILSNMKLRSHETPKKSRTEKKESSSKGFQQTTANTTVRKRNLVNNLIASDYEKIARRLNMGEFENI